MAEGAHLLTVKNVGATSDSAAGTLEFDSIVYALSNGPFYSFTDACRSYTGRGAFGTDSAPAPKSNNAAVIGGSVGGVLAALALVGGGVLFFLYRRKRRNNGSNGAVPATPNQPMIFQPQSVGSPYSPGTQPSFTPGTHPSSPVTTHSQFGSGYAGGEYGGGMSTGPYSGSGQQPVWAQGDSRRTSGVAPLPMWVERARRDDATSMATSDNVSSHPVMPTSPPHALYGSHHPGNAA